QVPQKVIGLGLGRIGDNGGLRQAQGQILVTLDAGVLGLTHQVLGADRGGNGRRLGGSWFGRSWAGRRHGRGGQNSQGENQGQIQRETGHGFTLVKSGGRSHASNDHQVRFSIAT